MARKQILSFDTSTLNRFVKDRDSDPYLAAILAAFDVRLPEMSIGEIYATPDAAQRAKLFTVCRRLLQVGQCLHPAHWILDLLVRRHHQDPGSFDWRSVDVRSPGVEREIHENRTLDSHTLVEQQRAANRKLQKEFKAMFQEPRDYIVSAI